jgi:hypothetical protein
MTVTVAERAKIEAEAYEQFQLEEKRKLSFKMSQLGKSRSKRKREAARESLKIANAVRLGRVLPKKRKK